MDIKENFRFQASSQDAQDDGPKKVHLSIYWKCCHVFSRIYHNREGDAYQGCCPRCHAKLRVPIGSGGTGQRIFIAR